MAGRIPQEFIDDLLARTDIVEVVGARLQLRKAGKDYQSLCPFHDEKSPSFTVSPAKQFYHCFGCGAHGSAISFLMEYDGLTFREAVEELAQRLGLDLPVGQGDFHAGPDHAPLYQLLEQVDLLYRRQLREHPQAPEVTGYLKGRGISGEIAQKFTMGYAPPGWDFLLSRLGASAQVRAQLMTCGLLAEQDGRTYDRFRNRVMFPIRDRRGRVIGFGGRILGNDGGPKYLNSPETPLFHKGRELYGLYEAQQAQRQLSSLLIVEGYLDVVSLAQFGFSNVVATLGTATTADHVKLLSRAAPDLVFCFDGDRAGREAAWKALEVALPFATGQPTLRFLFLPDGEDPDTLIRKEGRERFEERVASALPLSRFLFDHLASQLDMTTNDGRVRLVPLAQPLIDKVPQGVYREMLEQRLAELVGVPTVRSPRPRRRPSGRGRTDSARPSRIAQAIALLLDHPELAARAPEVAEDWRRTQSPGTEILVQLLETIRACPTITKAALLEHWREHEYFGYLQRLSVDPFLRDIPEEGIADEFVGALNRLSDEVRKRELHRPLNLASPSEWTDEARALLEREAAAARTRRRDL